MRYYALACDYDGTLAHHGKVDPATVSALERLRATGRKLLMVTGRQLPELLELLPEVRLFDWVVAENGALLYRPETREEKVIAQAPPPRLMQELAQRGVAPVAVGRVIVATWEPHETTVLQTIHDLGLEMQVIFNKGAVMILPASVNKATGLAAALEQMGMSPHEVVGVGDAENDHAFLSLCECGVAVANALPAIKERVDWVTGKDHGAGVVQLIDDLIRNDLSDLESRLTRHHLTLGTRAGDEPLLLPPYGPCLLIAGPSGSGKSTAATSLLERLSEKHYQFVIIDPEGDYEGLAGAVTLGDSQHGPAVQEVMEVLAQPSHNVVLNLLGLSLSDRPSFFMGLLPRLLEMRARTGRPHWLVVDEAHHLLPTGWQPGVLSFPKDLKRTVFLTVHPDQVAPAVLANVGVVVAVGKGPEETVQQFCSALKEPAPPGAKQALEQGEVLYWARRDATPPCRVRITASKTERNRHHRKYVEGELPRDRSFYFRGPEEKLNLRAQNLVAFLELAEGVDEATWLHHLRRGDYSKWFRAAIKDERLAEETETLEKEVGLSPKEGRARLHRAIERHYTLPAAVPTRPSGTQAPPSA